MKKAVPIALLVLLPLLAWGQTVSVTIEHMPSPHYTLFRIDEDQKVTRQRVFYFRVDGEWHDTVSDIASLSLTRSQHEHILRSAAAIKSLPKDSSIAIDGSWTQFEYREGDSVYQYGTFSDTPDSLADYLWTLFYRPEDIFISGQIGQPDTFPDCPNCWDVLPFARISVLTEKGDTVATTLADDHGNFKLNVLPGNYSIAVSHQGYDTRILTHVSLKEHLEIESFLLQPTKRKHRTIRESLSTQ